MVITIAGTAGLEAAFYGKPSIVFVDTIYSKSLSCVYRLRSIEELPIAIRTWLHKKVDTENLAEYVDLIEENSFNFDYFSLQANIGNVFFHGGFLKDIGIPIKKMEQFLITNKDAFVKLADEHIKKMLEHKT